MNSFHEMFFNAMVPRPYRMGRTGPEVKFNDQGVPYIKDAVVMMLNVPGAGSGSLYFESAAARASINKLIERSRVDGIPMQFGMPPGMQDGEGHEAWMNRLKTVPLSHLAGYIFNARVVNEWEGELLTPGLAVVGDIVPSDISEYGRSLQEMIRQGIFNWRLGARAVGLRDHGYSSYWASERLFSIKEINAIDVLFDDDPKFPEHFDDYRKKYAAWNFDNNCRMMANTVYGAESWPLLPEPKRPDETPVSFKVQVADVPREELERLGFDVTMTVGDIEGKLVAEEKHIELMTRRCDMPGADQEGFDFANAVARFVEDPTTVSRREFVIIHRPTRKEELYDEDTRQVEVREPDSE